MVLYRKRSRNEEKESVSSSPSFIVRLLCVRHCTEHLNVLINSMLIVTLQPYQVFLLVRTLPISMGKPQFHVALNKVRRVSK